MFLSSVFMSSRLGFEASQKELEDRIWSDFLEDQGQNLIDRTNELDFENDPDPDRTKATVRQRVLQYLDSVLHWQGMRVVGTIQSRIEVERLLRLVE